MVKQNAIKVFEEKKVRTLWDSDTEEWYFSIVDVVAVLTDSENPRRYWSDLKRKLAKEGSQLYEEIVQLKMLSSDGKYYKTDVATNLLMNEIPKRNNKLQKHKVDTFCSVSKIKL